MKTDEPKVVMLCWADLGAEVRATMDEYYVHFDILDEDGEPEMSGGVKWDGCSNWETSSECMLHRCDRDGLLKLGQIMARCWEWTSNNLPKFYRK